MELLRDKVHKDAYMVTKLMNMLKRGELRLDHPLQRNAGMWNGIARDGLIATIIKDEDVDSIKICEQLGDNGVTLWLIDGKQRLTTIQMFKAGMFKLGKTIEFPIVKYQVAQRNENGKIKKDEDGDIIYDIVEYDLRGKGYDDLPDELKEMVDNYKINVVKHLNCSDEEVGYHIRRYNRSVNMNSAQDSVTYMDNTAKYVKDISQNSRFFLDCGVYTETEKKKGIADRVVIESIMAMFHLNDWKKNGKKMGAYVNNHSGKEEFTTLKDEMRRLEDVIETPISLFNSKNTFIFLPLFHKFTSYGLEDKKFIEFLNEFENTLHSVTVDGMTFDEADANKATKDKKTVETKLHILEVLMKDFLHIKETDGEEVSELSFVQENVSSEIVSEDIDCYEDMLSDFTVNVDNKTKLLENGNHNSLIAIVAYSCAEDIDIEDWFVDYFNRHDSYIRNQVDNYMEMKRDLDTFVKKVA